ncbi:c-type cytochrome [bacterium]|nr:c-type cytochrome [bacterium]
MTVFWNGWIYLLSLGPLVLLTWLLYSNYKDSVSDKDHHRRHETHDGIGESFQPIPFWWAAVMYCLIAFAFIYLLLFPGLGSYNGLLSWSSMDSLHEEQQRINSKTDALLTQYESVDAEALSQDANAMLLGRRLFRQHCAACHGLNAQAEKNFPNLTDDDWLYEKSIASFQQTIRQGRQAAMPAWIGTLDKAHFDAVALYVHQLQFEENVLS